MWAKEIVGGLQLIGMASGCYVGARYGDSSKSTLLKKFPSAETQYNTSLQPWLRNSYISEPLFFNLVGALGGIGASWYFNGWIVTIPVALVTLGKDYPQYFKKLTPESKWWKGWGK